MEPVNPTFRILSAVLVIALIVWGSWWATWTLAIVLLFIFPAYYEILAWGVMYDALYGLALPQFSNFPYVFSAAALVLLAVSMYLRKTLLAYENKLQ